MADSDEEYERRRRDKFRRERPEVRGDDRRGGGTWGGNDRGGEHRDSWGSGYSKDAGGYKSGYKAYRSNDYGSRDRRGYSPNRHDSNPPMKRPRRDWDDNSFGGDNFHSSTAGATGGSAGATSGSTWSSNDQGGSSNTFSAAAARSQEGDFMTQPAMMLFKHFLAQQDDNITDEEAIKKYNEYKEEFKRTQLNEFFLAHKEEEWFRHKYHPEECVKTKAAEKEAVKHRCEVFIKLEAMNKIQAVTCDMTKSDELVNVLDAAVILMENGSEFDLTVLDRQPEVKKKDTPKDKESEESKKESEVKTNGDAKKEETGEIDEDDDGAIDDDDDETPEAVHKNKDTEKDKDTTAADNQDKPDEDLGEIAKDSAEPIKDETEEPQPAQQDMVDESDYFKVATAVPTEEEEIKEAVDGAVEKPDQAANAAQAEEDVEEKNEAEEGEKKPDEDKEEGKTSNKETRKRKREYSGDSYSGSESSFSSSGSSSGSDSDSENEEEDKEDDNEPKPRALHKTKSIFLRNLAATTTTQEVEAMCKRYPGFLRVSLQDPQPERRFMRRGWVTFDRTVNINNICWNLNNIRLRDCEMGAIVNRDLTGRIRSVNSLTAHKDVARQDIKHAAKIIQNMDKRYGLWEPEPPAPAATVEGDGTGDGQQSEDSAATKKNRKEKKDKHKANQPVEMEFGLKSGNPILENIIDYLVEEGSYEEEALLGHITGVSKSKDDEEDGVAIERDENLIKVIDRMILYLRIVHSYDYYTAVEYPNEDEMPHRCGMMHARATNNNRVAYHEIQDWISTFEHKCAPWVNAREALTEEEVIKLGMKDQESEVRRFITSNTQELAKDKWLCPLSGKKFKGPEFVKKHILNKHAEKVEEVKLEVEYFNNYLRDPKRPQLPEHPGPRGRSTQGPSNMSTPGGGFQSQGGSYQSSYRGGFQGGYRGGYRGFRGRRPYQSNFYQRRDAFPRRRGGRDPRGIIEYRDLDAVDDMDF